MKRLAAVLVAVAMIVGAVLLRDRIDGDDGGGGRDRGDTPLRLRCDTGLADVCARLDQLSERIDVTVVDAGSTADELAAADVDATFDAWLTTSSWPAIVADNRSFEGLDGAVLGASSEVLARSPVMIATRQQSAADLEAACGGPIDWRCIGGQPSARVGIADPETGNGLVVLAAATDSWFGGSDYSTVDFEDPAFGLWFDDLTSLSAATRLGRQTPLARALTRAGEFTTVGSLEAETSRLLRDRRDYVAFYAEPMVTADVVLVPRDGLDAADLLDEIGADQMTTALSDTGWRIDGVAPPGAQDAPALPDGSGLPSPGVLQALRDRW